MTCGSERGCRLVLLLNGEAHNLLGIRDGDAREFFSSPLAGRRAPLHSKEMSGHPTRVAHLLPVSLLAELLSPSYASANNRDAIDVFAEMKQGLLAAGLHRPLCDAVWGHLRDAHPDLDDDVVVERLAKALARKGGPRAKAATKAREEGMTALFAAIDIHIGRASDAARLALETPPGRKALQEAVKKAAEHLVVSLKLGR